MYRQSIIIINSLDENHSNIELALMLLSAAFFDIMDDMDWI